MTTPSSPAGSAISAVLRHDDKQTSYKIALLRAINDVALAFPDMHTLGRDVAIPLRALADAWIGYYWPFIDPHAPIYQGPRARRGETLRNDMGFRPALSELRAQFAREHGVSPRPADGALLVSDLQHPRRRLHYSSELIAAYREASRAVQRVIEMPIRYAGPPGSEWAVFPRPVRVDALGPSVAPLPGSRPSDRCLVVPAELWATFRTVSLWVESLCIHEWALFSETVEQGDGRKVSRGQAYELLTNRPESRQPLTWERNHIAVLLLEGKTFVCPWTSTPIRHGDRFDIDHLLPIAVYPVNELWNLAPAEPAFNQHTKRDRIPSPARLAAAVPHLAATYGHYAASPALARALADDVGRRFARLAPGPPDFSLQVARAAADFVDRVAELRSLQRF